MAMEPLRLRSKQPQLCHHIFWHLSFTTSVSFQIKRQSLLVKFYTGIFQSAIATTFSKSFIHYRIYTRNSDMEKTLFALETTPYFLKHLEQYIDFKYELPKVYSVAMADFVVGKQKNDQLTRFFFND